MKISINDLNISGINIINQKDRTIMTEDSIKSEKEPRYSAVYLNGQLVCTLCLATLKEYPLTYLGVRATRYKGFAGVVIKGDTIHISVFYTPRYFDRVIDFYYTGCLLPPPTHEVDLYYTIMDFWVIPYKEKHARSEMKDMIDNLEQKFDALVSSWKEIIPGLKGTPGCTGPPGCMGPPGRKGPDGRPGPPSSQGCPCGGHNGRSSPPYGSGFYDTDNTYNSDSDKSNSGPGSDDDTDNTYNSDSDKSNSGPGSDDESDSD